MKIRIRGNSIRIRVSRSEVELLAAEGRLEEKTELPNGTFSYILQSSNEYDHLNAGYEHGAITMYIPHNIATQWAGNDTVGYEYNLPLTNGGVLYLLLEKDFKCIDAAVKEDQSDNYENPLKSC